MNPIIALRDLRKSFGRLEVLKGVDMDVMPGRVTAVVGHNGSGKTTLIKSILGLVKPDAGTIRFGQEELNGDSEYRRRIGYMAQSAHFPDNLTALDLFAMLEDLRGNAGARKETLIKSFGLFPELEKPVRTLSGGNRQKVSAVMAFMFEPEVLILDEPTAGLDPVSSSVLKDLVHADRARGRSFILTSHIMSEIEELADHVVFLQDGRVRFDGPIDDVRTGTGEQNLERAIAQLMMEVEA
ncbi:MAG: ABC transporter ATP-binding protein [Rhodothermales bacterium]